VIDVAEGKVGFPIYFQTGTERSVQDVAERLLTVIKLANPALVNAPISGWPAIRRIGLHVGTVLASLGYQLDKAEELLFQTQEWEKSGKFAAAIARCPEAKPAVDFFRHRYRAMSQTEKSRMTTAFLDAIAPLTGDPLLRKVFAANTPGIDWQADVQATGETVSLVFKNILDPESRRFAMLWIFLSLYEFMKQRGRKAFPFVVTIDEFAALTQQVSAGVNPLAVLMNEFITQYMRNHQIWFTCAFQSISQLDEQLRKTVLGLGNLVVGRTALDEARVLANLLARKNPYLPKLIEEEWREEEHDVWVKHSRGYHRETKKQWVLVDQEVTSYLSLEEQQELYAQKIASLRRFEFLLRPAVLEGEVAAEVKPISIAKYARNRETGEYEFPNQEHVAKLRARLAAYSGMQAKPGNKEQEAQPTERPGQKPPGQMRVIPLPAGKSAEEVSLPDVPAAPVQMPDAAQPVPVKARATPSLPTLDEAQRVFLAFLIANPETPISVVYKELGFSVGIGTKLRDSLKAQGLLAELEVRTGSTGAGRPTKLVIPTFAALELFGIAPPPGRGGVIHRYLQQVVAQGARTKGYRAQLEYALANGAIVDVHLEKGAVRIAVEIAVVSTPEREVAHIRNCLAVGYDQVFGIFADETLLERTATVLQETFPQEEAGKVRLLPLQHLAYLG
jgi:hypothetical protein